MGANFDRMTVPGDKTKEEVKKAFEERQQDCRHEYGSHYTGTLAECTGLQFVNREFPNVIEAENWLQDNCQKWETAKCVRAHVMEKGFSQHPTFTGTKYPHTNCRFGLWQSRACLVQVVWNKDKQANEEFCYPADQLSDEEKASLKEAWLQFHRKMGEMSKANSLFKTEVDKVTSLDQEPSFELLKQVREQFKEAKAIFEAARDAFIKLDTDLASKLYTEKVEDKGVVWVIGGICSS